MELILTRLADGSGSLLDPRTMDFWTLNRTGARIWELLSGGASDEEAAERLAAEFDVDAPTAREVVAAFVAELATAGLRPRP